MRKWIAWLLVLVLAASLLTGCDKDKKEPSLKDTIQQVSDNKPEEAPGQEDPKEDPKEDSGDVGGQLYDAGNVTVLAPDGWKAFPETDVFAEEEGAMNPNVLNIIKGGKTEADMFIKPYVRINYFGPDILMGKPDASWYEDVKDIDPFTAGEHEWYGFTCDSLGTALAIVWCEEGDFQYQASITLGSGSDTISTEDADVRAILASVMPSDPSAVSAEKPEEEPEVEDDPYAEDDPAMAADFWAGQWYGWWCIKDATGDYEIFNDIAWDLYAEIEDYGDGTGYLTMWDTETSREVPLVRGYLNFEEGFGSEPALVSDYCTFFDGGEWLPEAVTVHYMDFDNWYVDPAVSTVSQFENMIEIVNYYEDPENSENYFAYYMYLRPWGMEWGDVAEGDTSGCIYSDMMPILYGDWYLPLLDMGVDTLPGSLAEGFEIIEHG